MLITFFSILSLSMISLIVMMIASILSKKPINDREKSSPFECGFDPMSSSRIPFSLRFFLITIIFLIFDVEIALLLPLMTVVPYSSLSIWMFTVTWFIIILLVGLYHEWNQGMLTWSY